MLRCCRCNNELNRHEPMYNGHDSDGNVGKQCNDCYTDENARFNDDTSVDNQLVKHNLTQEIK